MTVAGAPLSEQVLTAQSALDTASTPIFAAGYSNIGAVCAFSVGTSAGVVTLEAGPSPAYTGAWISLGTPATQIADTAVRIQAINSALPYVRARISTAIVGGTVTVVIVAN